MVCCALDNVWICRSSTYRYILQIQLIIFLTSCAESTENIFNFYTLELTPEKGLNVSLLPFIVISLPLMWRLNFIFLQFPQPQNSIKISSTSSPDGSSHITTAHHEMDALGPTLVSFIADDDAGARETLAVVKLFLRKVTAQLGGAS